MDLLALDVADLISQHRGMAYVEADWCVCVCVCVGVGGRRREEE